MPSWISFQPLLAALAMYYAELGERVVLVGVELG